MRSTQDAFTSIWINYYATRAALSQQLGVMDLTDEGMWIDKPFALAERATEDEMPLPPAVPDEWLEHLEEIDAPAAIPAKAAAGTGAGLAPGVLPPPAARPDVKAEPIPAPGGDAGEPPPPPAGGLLPLTIPGNPSAAGAGSSAGWRGRRSASAGRGID
jgi:hypothetical protein